MKNIIIGIILIGFNTLNAQTNIIANKSHSGDFSEINEESANFGLDERMLIDSVIYIGGDCIVEVRNAWRNFQSRDTICDNFYFKEHGYSYESAFKAYNSNTAIIGFKKPNQTIDKSKNWNKNNSITWFFVLLLTSSIVYIFKPLKKN